MYGVDFVRSGQQRGSAHVQLYNASTSDPSFEKYGHTITLVCSVEAGKDGTRTYEIQSNEGVLLSDSSEEIRRVLSQTGFTAQPHAGFFNDHSPDLDTSESEDDSGDSEDTLPNWPPNHCSALPVGVHNTSWSSSHMYEHFMIKSGLEGLLDVLRKRNNIRKLVKDVLSADFNKECPDNTERLNQAMKSTEKAIKRRARTFKVYRRSIATFMRMKFNKALGTQGWCGDIRFDHNDGTLQLESRPIEQSPQSPLFPSTMVRQDIEAVFLGVVEQCVCGGLAVSMWDANQRREDASDNDDGDSVAVETEQLLGRSCRERALQTVYDSCEGLLRNAVNEDHSAVCQAIVLAAPSDVQLVTEKIKMTRQLARECCELVL